MSLDQIGKSKSKISDFTQNATKTQKLNLDTKAKINQQLQSYTSKQFGKYLRVPFRNFKFFLAFGFFFSTKYFFYSMQRQNDNSIKEKNQYLLMNKISNAFQAIEDIKLLRIQQREQYIDKQTLPEKEYYEIYVKNNGESLIREQNFIFSRGAPKRLGKAFNILRESF